MRESQLEETLQDARQYGADTPILLAGDLNFDVFGGAAASAISRAQVQDAFANQHLPTTPNSFFEGGRTIDWIFSRGPTGLTAIKGSAVLNPYCWLILIAAYGVAFWLVRRA